MRKRRLIGGLAGGIGALVLIGLIATQAGALSHLGVPPAKATPSSNVNAANSDQKGGVALPLPTPADWATLTTTLLIVPSQWKQGVFATPRQMHMPTGFRMSLYAINVSSARELTVAPDGRIFVGTESGNIYWLQPSSDGKTATQHIFATGLNNPADLVFHNGYLYVGCTDIVARYTFTNGQQQASGPPQTIITMPHRTDHITTSISFGPDGKLYVAAGGPCNVCTGSDPHLAAIWSYNDDGTNPQMYASGIRNAVGQMWAADGTMWANTNQRDNLGDNLPPEAMFHITPGAFYGWPYCYPDMHLKMRNDPDVNGNGQAYDCTKATPPTAGVQAHMAPLSMITATGFNAPTQFTGPNVVFQGFHGSWNHSNPGVGDKVMIGAIQSTGTLTGLTGFATGWELYPSGNRWGRVVGVVIGNDHNLYISDDQNGVVYKMWYQG